MTILNWVKFINKPNKFLNINIDIINILKISILLTFSNINKYFSSIKFPKSFLKNKLAKRGMVEILITSNKEKKTSSI